MSHSRQTTPEPAAMPGGRRGLRRTLGLTLTVLFGLGVTIGAGIYVLIGATIGKAGAHAPWAFIIAAIVMAPTAASFAELATRYPVSAGEAAYVRAGFRLNWLALATGLMVMIVGVVSAAAISRGSGGYLQALTGLPLPVAVAAVAVTMGLLATRGIAESLLAAGIMTLIEIGGLIVVVAAGWFAEPVSIGTSIAATAGTSGAPWLVSGLLSATLLAFFAFIGFEGLANIAEEVNEPERNLPRAILATLVLSTLLYVLVAWTALRAVPQAELAASSAPLSLVFGRLTGASPAIISLIAVIATANGVIVQIVMASRVLYGLADKGLLPAGLAVVNQQTQAPLRATLLVSMCVLVMALAIPIEELAETTSRLTLVIFWFVNAALLLLKQRGEARLEEGGFTVPRIVPLAGMAFCTALLVGSFFTK